MTLLLWALALGCGGAPAEEAGWLQSTSLFGLTQDGGLLYLRATVGNTGLWKGAGHLRLVRSLGEGAPITLARHEPAERVQRDPAHGLLMIGPDGFSREEGRHAFVHRGPESGLSLTLWPSALPAAEASRLTEAGERHVEIGPLCGAFDGWLEAGGVGGRLGGKATLLRDGGDRPAPLPRYTFFAADGDTCLFVDGSPAEALGSVSDAGVTIPLGLAADDAGGVRLAPEGLATHTWSAVGSEPVAQFELDAHLHPLERSLAAPLRRGRTESLWAIRISGTLGSRPAQLNGLLRVVEP